MRYNSHQATDCARSSRAGAIPRRRRLRTPNLTNALHRRWIEGLALELARGLVAAKEETAAWKVKHGELRAFVAAELVNEAASK